MCEENKRNSADEEELQAVIEANRELPEGDS